MFGCKHNWKTLGFKRYIDTSYNLNIKSTQFHLQCEKCGKIIDVSIDGWVRYEDEDVDKYNEFLRNANRVYEDLTKN